MTHNMLPKQKVILCILDGWGVNAAQEHNGIYLAKTPHWDRILKENPHTTLQASELYVGLPEGQMGNSEVGHMTIGSGRLNMQDLPRVDQAISQHTLENIPAFQSFIKQAKTGTKVIHLLGLLSPGGIHSHQNHILALATLLAERNFQIKIHSFLDGRDTPPQMAASILKDFIPRLPPSASLETIGGRYFAMDRDNRWERIQKAYDSIVSGKSPLSKDFIATIQSYYDQNIGDEFIPPYQSSTYTGMKEGDALMMVNFRADRVRQLLTAILSPSFDSFDRSTPIHFSATLGLFDYSPALTPLIPPLFCKDSINNTLGDVISQRGLHQLRLAETEKYAHVTFFFNGGREVVFPGENRHLIPSPAVATYDLKPEMSAAEITHYLTEQLKRDYYDLIVVNYANADMVGHTGVIPAIIHALETLDECLGTLATTAKEMKYALIITADHGNVEMMVDPTSKTPHTAHTLNPVPFVLMNVQGTSQKNLHPGTLQDIAPTILKIMGIPIPLEMTGKALF